MFFCFRHHQCDAISLEEKNSLLSDFVDYDVPSVMSSDFVEAQCNGHNYEINNIYVAPLFTKEFLLVWPRCDTYMAI